MIAALATTMASLTSAFQLPGNAFVRVPAARTMAMRSFQWESVCPIKPIHYSPPVSPAPRRLGTSPHTHLAPVTFCTFKTLGPCLSPAFCLGQLHGLCCPASRGFLKCP